MTPVAPKEPMVMRSLYVPEKLWNAAKAKADGPDSDENLSDVVRRKLQEYLDEEK